MANDVTKHRPTDANGEKRPAKTVYVFKDASELPKSKPDYVVMSPTPLGRRAVPQADRSERS